MLPNVMVDSNTTTRKIHAARPRFSLRFLFAVSIALAAPFVTGAFLRDVYSAKAAGPSPVFVILGIVALFMFYAVGHAVASNIGAWIATVISAACWLALIVWAFLLGDPLAKQLPIHIAAMIGTLLGILSMTILNRRAPDEDPVKWIQPLKLV